MEYRKLGQTSLRVSEISLGCSGFWGNRKFPEKQAIYLVKKAFDSGVNFFDTGHNYSGFNAEPRLGRAIKEILKESSRSNLIISSKAGTTIPRAKLFSSNQNSSSDFSPDYIEKICEKSIKNLNCDYLDVFQLHGITQAQITDELLERLERMKKDGMFSYLGVNTHEKNDMFYIADNPSIFDMVLIDYNILQLDREPVIKKLHESGVGVVAGTILAQGHLLKGKIGSIRSKADIWYLARAVFKKSSRKLALNSRDMKKELSLISEMTPAQASFSFILDNPYIASCTFGTTNAINLEEVINSSSKKLSESNKTIIRNTFNSKVSRYKD